MGTLFVSNAKIKKKLKKEKRKTKRKEIILALKRIQSFGLERYIVSF